MKKFKNNFAVTGSVTLLEAFEKELKEIGYINVTPTHTYEFVTDNFRHELEPYILINDYGRYGIHNHHVEYENLLTLPQDWNEAIELANETREFLFKTEDGVDIYEGDKLYYVSSYHDIIGPVDTNTSFSAKRIFSSYQAAQQWIKENKPKEEQYKVGDWVIVDNYSYKYDYTPLKIKSIELSYGKNYYYFYNSIEDDDNFRDDMIVRKATTEEIEKELIKQAKKRGYEGKEIIMIEGDFTIGNKVYYKLTDISSYIYSELNDKLNVALLSNDQFTIYKQGQWAEIIEEKEKYIEVLNDVGNDIDHKECNSYASKGKKLKVIREEHICNGIACVYVCEGGYVIYNDCAKEITKEEYLNKEPQIEINGYKAEFHNKYVKFGCQSYSKEFIITLNDALQNNNLKMDYKNQIKQIADYYATK